MKKYISFLCVALFIATNTVSVFAESSAEMDISAQAAILMDAETGQVLYEKDANSRRHPASITKIMTALLVLERMNPSDTIITNKSAVNLPSWSSSAYLKEGERLTVEKTMYAMMLRSGNDAANVLAEAGSTSGFAELMNERAAELGAVNTNFSNPHGLPRRDHLTTAYDMALITRAAIRTPNFLTYFGADSYSMPGTNKNSARVFTNTHKMLLSGYSQYDETVIGGKTGYTMPSGYTLVTAAQRDGRTLICVVLNSGTVYADTKALFEFGFSDFSAVTYRLEHTNASLTVSLFDGDQETGRAYLSAPRSASLLLHNSVSEEDLSIRYEFPESSGVEEEIEAYASIVLSDTRVEGLPEPLLSVPMKVESVRLDPPAVQTMSLPADPGSVADPQQEHSIALPLPAIAAAGFLLLFIAASIVHNRWRAQKRRRRRFRKYAQRWE